MPPLVGGLITTPTLQVRYHEASEQGATEDKTKHLWQELFTGENSRLRLAGHSLTSEVRPSKASGKACDLAVSYVAASGTDMRVLVFIECKRESTKQFAKLEDLEQQALQYGMDYLKETPQPYVYVMTAKAAYARLFKLDYAKDALQYAWGQPFKGDLKGYYDIAEPKAADKFLSEWNRILQEPPTMTLNQQMALSKSPAKPGTDPKPFRADVELFTDPVVPGFYLYKYFDRFERDPIAKWTNRGGRWENEQRPLFATKVQNLDLVTANLNGAHLHITSGPYKGKQIARNRCYKDFWYGESAFRLYCSLGPIKVFCKIKES